MKNLCKKIIFLIALNLSLIAIIGCGTKVNDSAEDENKIDIESNENTQNDIEANENLPEATIKIAGFGEVKVELYPETAPNTVNNFIDLASSGFYDGLKFHRVIDGFMIQGGDPKGDGTGGPGYSIEGEFTSNGFANSLKHTEGVISMARSQNPNSAGSQFFIMTSTSKHLDGEYAAFGKVISGMDIVKKIEKVKTSSNDMPVDDVVIESIKIDTKDLQYSEPKKIE